MELKNVLFQVYELGKNGGNFEEFWERWKDSTEFADILVEHLLAFPPPGIDAELIERYT